MNFDNLFQQCQSKVDQLTPEPIKKVKKTIKTNCKTAVQTGLSRFDFVTRQEFDTQVAVLQKTRQKLDALEQKLDTLLAEQADNQQKTSTKHHKQSSETSDKDHHKKG